MQHSPFKHDSERRLLCWMMRETKDESFLVWTVVDLESIGSRVLSLIEIQQYVGDSHTRVCAHVKSNSMLVTVTIVSVPMLNPTVCW